METQHEQLASATRHMRSRRRVSAALDRSLAEARRQVPLAVDAPRDRWIRFSDHHPVA